MDLGAKNHTPAGVSDSTGNRGCKCVRKAALKHGCKQTEKSAEQGDTLPNESHVDSPPGPCVTNWISLRGPPGAAIISAVSQGGLLASELKSLAFITSGRQEETF